MNPLILAVKGASEPSTLKVRDPEGARKGKTVPRRTLRKSLFRVRCSATLCNTYREETLISLQIAVEKIRQNLASTDIKPGKIFYETDKMYIPPR